MLRKVVSGGQTGVDRAGLDAAMGAGIPVGGYCPKGRLAEDGIIPSCYPVTELESPAYRDRTEKNVVESDGTLILNKGVLSEGTRVTSVFAAQHGKPCLVVQLDAAESIAPEQVIRWLGEQRIGILNIAGPRESKYPEGIHGEARAYLESLFSKLKAL
jgi:hypothetical protein